MNIFGWLHRSCQTRFRCDYCGFVEGSDLVKGSVDIVVTDGFSGNVAL